LNDICKELNLNCGYVSGEDVERERPDFKGKVKLLLRPAKNDDMHNATVSK